MKPTTTMLNRLRARPAASPAPAGAQPAPERSGERPAPPRPPAPAIPEAAQRVSALMRELRRADSEDARASVLAELSELRASLRPARSRADEVASEIRDAALATPAPALPGEIAVRLLGVGDDGARVPLAGLRARVKRGDRVIEAVTDAAGLAHLRLDAAGGFDVEVLAPGGEVVGGAQSRLSAGQSAPLQITIQRRAEIEDSYARGLAWSEAVQARAERLEAGRRSDAAALEERIAALEASVADLIARLEALSAGARREGGVTTGHDDATKGDDHG